MSQRTLFDLPAERVIAPASSEGWERVKRTLTKREVEVFLALHRYVETSGYHDATGGELAAFSGLSVLNVRPRLTGLDDKGWIVRLSIRSSRIASEARCHPYRPALPAAAIKRLRSEGR